YARMFRDQLRGQIRFGADRENIVVVAEDLKRLHERSIVAQHDQALSRYGFRPGKGAYSHSLTPLLLGAGTRGASRHFENSTGGNDHGRDVSRHPGTDSVNLVMTLVSLSLKPPVRAAPQPRMVSIKVVHRNHYPTIGARAPPAGRTVGLCSPLEARRRQK